MLTVHKALGLVALILGIISLFVAGPWLTVAVILLAIAILV